MLGSAKTNLPLLSLTSWVRVASPFAKKSVLKQQRENLQKELFWKTICNFDKENQEQIFALFAKNMILNNNFKICKQMDQNDTLQIVKKNE